MTLPAMVDGNGEVVRLVTADDLLAAGGVAVVTDADTLDLAQFCDNADHLTAIAREAKGVVSDELVKRLDRRGKWTLHVGAFTIKAPSPEAGTVAYDTDKLREALTGLLAEKSIDAEGARGALEPSVPSVPITAADLDALEMAARAGDADVSLAVIVRLRDRLPDVTYTQKPGGIKALLKVPAAKELIEACRVDVDPPARRATVKMEASRA